VEGWHLLVPFAVVLVVAPAIAVRALAGRPRREKAGYAVGLAVYVALSLLSQSLPGDERDWPSRLVAAVLAVVVAVDLLRQVPQARPSPGQVGLAIGGWGVGAFLLTPIVVAVYVARRVMHLPVIARMRVNR
jgi:hypothetical protein